MFRASLIASTMLVPALAAAQGSDTQEVSRYVLTDAGFTKYAQATNRLSALDVGDCGEYEGDNSDTPSISAAVAKVAFYRKHANEITRLGEAAQATCDGDDGEEGAVEES